MVDVNQSLKVGRDFEHVVFDTKARPDREELKTLAEGCDLMVIPTTPDAMSIEALMGTVDMLRSIGVGQFKILITIIPPYPERDGEDARAMLEGNGYPLFASGDPRGQGFQAGGTAGPDRQPDQRTTGGGLLGRLRQGRCGADAMSDKQERKPVRQPGQATDAEGGSGRAAAADAAAPPADTPPSPAPVEGEAKTSAGEEEAGAGQRQAG